MEGIYGREGATAFVNQIVYAVTVCSARLCSHLVSASTLLACRGIARLAHVGQSLDMSAQQCPN
eukprot:6180301-Pleurochrysis_carterae.AAC.2